MASLTELDRRNPGPSLRWAITALIVVVLVYPFALWLRESGLVGTTGPSLPPGHIALQHSFEALKAGRYQEAIDAARAALAKNPDIAEAYNNIAASSLELGRYDEGIAAAQEALRLQPDFDVARFNLAWLQQVKAAAADRSRPRKVNAERHENAPQEEKSASRRQSSPPGDRPKP